MLEKKPKPKDVDKILRYLNSDSQGKNPVEFTEKEMEKFARMSFCHNLRKKGYSRTMVRDALIKEYGVQLNYAYTIIKETELVIGPTHVSVKDYDRAVVEEMILEGYRMALATKNINEMGRYIDRFMKLKGVMESEDAKLPIGSLTRNKIYLSLNPEDVGMPRIPLDEIKAFVSEMQKAPAPKIRDITPQQDVEDGDND